MGIKRRSEAQYAQVRMRGWQLALALAVSILHLQSGSDIGWRKTCAVLVCSRDRRLSRTITFWVVEEGATVRFQCAIVGHPTPWVTWDKDGLILTPSRRLTIKEKDDLRLVEISEVTVEDAGLYRATLENDVGRIEGSARLDVIDADR
ncbi:leucine-rich repeats and immunoglobulin-like domains protein 3 [Cloeon dipterum]|uniref:leucine-rich repeats and immunoglobulin-like domains protein 3 n=1 Tax=Cloeon dipterum TaxID=197152 RepID=UPI00321FE014